VSPLLEKLFDKKNYGIFSFWAFRHKLNYDMITREEISVYTEKPVTVKPEGGWILGFVED